MPRRCNSTAESRPFQFAFQVRQEGSTCSFWQRCCGRRLQHCYACGAKGRHRYSMLALICRAQLEQGVCPASASACSSKMRHAMQAVTSANCILCVLIQPLCTQPASVGAGRVLAPTLRTPSKFGGNVARARLAPSTVPCSTRALQHRVYKPGGIVDVVRAGSARGGWRGGNRPACKPCRPFDSSAAAAPVSARHTSAVARRLAARAAGRRCWLGCRSQACCSAQAGGC